MRRDPTEPVEAAFGRERTVFLDAYTGAILGEGLPRVRRFFQTVTEWRPWLATGSENRAAGRAVTGACNLAFLFLILSGPFLWLPRRFSWQHIRPVPRPRWSLSGKARDFNWHNSLGIWSALPLAVIVASAVVMSYPWANNLLYTLTGTTPSAQGTRGGGPPRAERREVNYAGLDRLWARAETQVADYRGISLRLGGPAVFTIDTGNGGEPQKRSHSRSTGERGTWSGGNPSPA